MCSPLVEPCQLTLVADSAWLFLPVQRHLPAIAGQEQETPPILADGGVEGKYPLIPAPTECQSPQQCGEDGPPAEEIAAHYGGDPPAEARGEGQVKAGHPEKGTAVRLHQFHRFVLLSLLIVGCGVVPGDVWGGGGIIMMHLFCFYWGIL